MDRCRTQRSLARSSMQTLGSPPFEPLLRTGGAERLRSRAYEAGRRDLYGVALLRFSEDSAGATEGGSPSQSQTGAGDYARPWAGWESTGPQYLESPSRPSQVSISPTRYRDPESPASVEFGHHIYPTEKRLCLPRCRNGLVQSTSTLASTLEQSGDGFLSGGVRGGCCHLWSAGNFQHRPRSTVHLTRVCERGTQQGHPVQHGRTGEGPRQHFCRTSMEVCKI